MAKAQTRERLKLDEMFKGGQSEVATVQAELALLSAHVRSLESQLVAARADVRRLHSDHKGNVQKMQCERQYDPKNDERQYPVTQYERECDTLGKAIHSMAGSLHLSTPVGGTPSGGGATGYVPPPAPAACAPLYNTYSYS